MVRGAETNEHLAAEIGENFWKENAAHALAQLKEKFQGKEV